MTESIQKVIKRLQKFNRAYFNSYLDKCKIIRYENLDDFCDVFLLEDDKVLTIEKDGSQISEFDSFNKFDQYLGNAVSDAFVINITESIIEPSYKSLPQRKNNTIWFSNFKTNEIIIKYVMCYIVATIPPSNWNDINNLKSTKIPIVNLDDQFLLARKFNKQYKVIKFLKAEQTKLEIE